MDSLNPSVLTNSLGFAQDGLTEVLRKAMAELHFLPVDANSPEIPGLAKNVIPEDWAHAGPGDRTFHCKCDQDGLELFFKVSETEPGNRTFRCVIFSEVRRLLRFHCDSFFTRIIQDGNTVCRDTFATKGLTFLDETDTTFQVPSPTLSIIRIAGLMAQLNLKIGAVVFPPLGNEGYVEQYETASASEHAAGAPNDQPGVVQDGTLPFPDHSSSSTIGSSDLHPPDLAANPSSPLSLFPPVDRGCDDMFVGPEHPIFGRNSLRRSKTWSGTGIHLPPMGAPPGARFGPMSPFDGGSQYPHRRISSDPGPDSEFLPP